MTDPRNRLPGGETDPQPEACAAGKFFTFPEDATHEDMLKGFVAQVVETLQAADVKKMCLFCWTERNTGPGKTHLFQSGAQYHGDFMAAVCTMIRLHAQQYSLEPARLLEGVRRMLRKEN